MSLSAADLNGHTGDNEIGTPDDLFEWLDRRFQFDYDAFASDQNHLLLSYSTELHTVIHSVTMFPPVNEVDGIDGLRYPWLGLRVFWNPPYGRGIYTQCIEKAISEMRDVEISVGLCKYNASTVNGKLLRDNFHLEYLPRVRYKGMTTAAPFASVLAISKGTWK